VNTYHYVDPDHAYTDAATGLLRNLAGITDAAAALFLESSTTTKRLRELEAAPMQIRDSSALLAIHKHLFQDVYAWAGKVRTVEISKGGKPFFPTSLFANAFARIDTLIVEYGRIRENDKPAVARKLAEILDTVNYLHPFREGNGRTQREFLRLLALGKKLSLNLNPSNNATVYERYMSGTVNGDIETLSALILELIEKPVARASSQ